MERPWNSHLLPGTHAYRAGGSLGDHGDLLGPHIRQVEPSPRPEFPDLGPLPPFGWLHQSPWLHLASASWLLLPLYFQPHFLVLPRKVL